MKRVSQFIVTPLAVVLVAGACQDSTTPVAWSGPSFSSGLSVTGVAPTLVSGNIAGDGTQVCSDSRVNPGAEAWLGVKVDPPASGTYAGFTFTLSSSGQYLDWTAVGSNIMKAVVVKGGPNTHVYAYNPPARTSDQGLHSPTVGQGNVPQVSHFVLCYVEAPPEEGCSPGYWKNHHDSWPAPYAPTTSVGSVFTVPGSLSSLSGATLADALSFGGGSGTIGGARILLRHAVAALLNAAHPDVAFPLSTSSVITQVNTALASLNRATMLALASQLDTYNNLGCPLN